MLVVETVLSRRLSYADRALEELRGWPALDVCDAGRRAGVGLSAGAGRVVHLRWPGEAELCLTWPVIDRLSAALAASERVSFTQGSDWIRLPLESESDVRLLIPLVSLAIKVSTQGPHVPARRAGSLPLPASGNHGQARVFSR